MPTHFFSEIGAAFREFAAVLCGQRLECVLISGKRDFRAFSHLNHVETEPSEVPAVRRVSIVAFACVVSVVALAFAPRQDKPRALILTGQNNHDWKKTTPHLKELLEKTGGFAVNVSEDPEASILEDKAKLKAYKIIVLNINRNKRWSKPRETNFLSFVREGGGLVVVHAADNAFDGWDDYEKLIGGAWRAKGSVFPNRGTFHPTYGPFDVTIDDLDHPITKGLGKNFTTKDEKYTNLRLQDNIHVLAHADEQGKHQPLLFVSTYGDGRMFQTALGHDLDAMNNPQFIETFVRGALGGRLVEVIDSRSFLDSNHVRTILARLFQRRSAIDRPRSVRSRRPCRGSPARRFRVDPRNRPSRGARRSRLEPRPTARIGPPSPSSRPSPRSLRYSAPGSVKFTLGAKISPSI